MFSRFSFLQDKQDLLVLLDSDNTSDDERHELILDYCQESALIGEPDCWYWEHDNPPAENVEERRDKHCATKEHRVGDWCGDRMGYERYTKLQQGEKDLRHTAWFVQASSAYFFIKD